MVSHAKNRVGRLFRPNLQKLKVFKNGLLIRVKLCTSCIKRLKKDGRIGIFAVNRAGTSNRKVLNPVERPEGILKVLDKMKAVRTAPEAKKTEGDIAKETLKIESIVGKKA